MVQRLRILCDMDEVVVDLMDEWLRIYECLGGEAKTRKDITDYTMSTQVRDPELLFQAIDDYPVLTDAPQLPGALDALYKLYNAHDVYIVTYGRHQALGKAHEFKLDWLTSRAPWFDLDRVMFCRDKTFIDADVMIEDNLATLKAWQKRTGGLGFLIDQPWNRQALFGGQLVRVDGLADVAAALCDDGGDYEVTTGSAA